MSLLGWNLLARASARLREDCSSEGEAPAQGHTLRWHLPPDRLPGAKPSLRNSEPRKRFTSIKKKKKIRIKNSLYLQKFSELLSTCTAGKFSFKNTKGSGEESIKRVKNVKFINFKMQL